MFYENSAASSEFSFEGGLPASSTESEARHLINRLRLEFRTASQRQLEDAVNAALQNTPVSAGEKILQLARTSLDQLLTPLADRSPENVPTEPPFRALIKTYDANTASSS